MSEDMHSSPLAGEAIREVLRIRIIRNRGEKTIYVGVPLVPPRELLETLRPQFQAEGYTVAGIPLDDEFVLVATPKEANENRIPWTNIGLAIATIVTTLFAGASWYYVRDPLSPAILRALPFTLAVMGVLATHELGHYVMSRYHNVDASLPYFIPFPNIIGTMGAVIRLKGVMPDRKALFDIGVAGPLAGLVATIIVTTVGLLLSPVTVPTWVVQQSTIGVKFGNPPLLRLIAWILGEPLRYPSPHKAVSPIVFGGWVGMFVTFLNLLPVGQLDGGHILRAIMGEQQERIAALVPVALFGLAGLLYVSRGVSDGVTIWVLWGLLAAVFARTGSATPLDESPIDHRRVLIGLVTFIFGILSFTPVPIQIVG